MFGLARRGAGPSARMRVFNVFFTAVLRVMVEWFNADADVVKDMVCSNKVREKGGGEKIERPQKGRDNPQETGGAETDLSVEGSAPNRSHVE